MACFREPSSRSVHWINDLRRLANTCPGDDVPSHGHTASASPLSDPRRLDPAQTLRQPPTGPRREAQEIKMIDDSDHFRQGLSGSRSGAQTSFSPTAAAPAISDDNRIESLTAVLNEFTSHVTEIATLSIQRDTAKRSSSNGSKTMKRVESIMPVSRR